MIDDDAIYRRIGVRLREIRASRSPKLTQAQLAEMIGVQRTSLSNIEKGAQRPPLSLLYRVADELNLTINDLIPRVEEVKIKKRELAVEHGDETHHVPEKTAELLKRLESSQR